MEHKYNIGDTVLTRSGRIETISGIDLHRDAEPKYWFDRFWTGFKRESDIVKKIF